MYLKKKEKKYQKYHFFITNILKKKYLYKLQKIKIKLFHIKIKLFHL